MTDCALFRERLLCVQNGSSTDLHAQFCFFLKRICRPNQHPSQNSTPSICSTSPSIDEAPAPRNSGLIIPDHWRSEIELCIEDKCFTDSARNQVVRTLVNQLFAKSSKPTRSDCEKVARKLILVYPFARDNLGNGYVSIYHACWPS